MIKSDAVVIWSGQWQAYWREKSAGYAKEIWDAGLYERAEAEALTGHCGPEKQIEIRDASQEHAAARSILITDPKWRLGYAEVRNRLSAFSDDEIARVAMSIEGPWNTNGFLTEEKLTTLRLIRWNQLSEQDRGVRIQEAQSALLATQSLIRNPRG